MLQTQNSTREGQEPREHVVQLRNLKRYAGLERSVQGGGGRGGVIKADAGG